MSTVICDRVTVEEDAEFSVLLIGMRINKLWKVHRWFPVAWSMKRMVSELNKNKEETGYLGGEYRSVGNPIIFVQYWRSYEALEKYTSDKRFQHRETWSNFFKKIALGGDVGIWHETYKVKPGQYECIYLNMPRFGLGKVFPIVSANNEKRSSRGRMENTNTRT